MTMRTRLTVAAMLVSFGCALWVPAAAGDDLSTILSSLNDITQDQLAPTGHDAHFSFANSPQNAAVVRALNGAIAGQFTTFPIASSSGGFTYSVDPATGVASSNSKTFGPQFVERAPTNGKGKINFGVQFLHVGYDSLNGTDLKNTGYTLQLIHEDTNGDGGTVNFDFEGDVISSKQTIDLTLDTALVVGTWGVTDRFDLGIAIPIVRAQMDATAFQTINPLATGAFNPHLFLVDPSNPGGATTLQRTVSSSSTATGVGDVLLRAKWNFLKQKNASGLSAAFDLRLGSGDENNYLGTGVTQAKLFLIGSWTIGRFAPHFNAGYTYSSGNNPVVGTPPDEVNYAIGFEAECHPRVTFILDGIGRYLRDAPTVDQGTIVHDYTDPNTATPTSIVLPQLTVEKKNLNLAQGAVGLKINPGGNWLISIAALVPLTDDGLKSGPIGMFGFEYNF
jgi:hypothetical protein